MVVCLLASLVLAKCSPLSAQEADQSGIVLDFPSQEGTSLYPVAAQPPTPGISPETPPETPPETSPETPPEWTPEISPGAAPEMPGESSAAPNFKIVENVTKILPITTPYPTSDVYIVRLRAAPPIAGYTGGINGIPATAAKAVRDSASDVLHSVVGRIRQTRRQANRKSSRLNLRSPAVARFNKWLGRLQDGVADDVKLPRANVLYSMRHVSNAFVARLTPKQLQQLKRHPAVAEIKPNYPISKLTTNSANFLKLPETLWSTRGRDRAGEGVVVGIIDTGIWPEHPSFSSDVDLLYPDPPATWKGTCQVTADFQCNRKVIGARYFNGGFRAAYGQEDTLTDWTSPRDADGHGTWCAAAAAGNSNVPIILFPRKTNLGNITGMAPRAFLAAYKVFWGNAKSAGTTATSADVEAAVNAAVADGVDVISLSLGSADPSATYFSDLAYLYANLAGTVVVYASGNSGPPPFSWYMYRSISNFSPFYLTVGASTIARRYTSAAILGDGRIVPLFGFGSGNVAVQRLGLVEGAAARAAWKSESRAQYCTEGSLNATKVAGKIVLCAYGSTSTASKAAEVASKGGKAIIVTDMPVEARLFPPIYEVRLPVMGAEAGATSVLRNHTRTMASPTASFAYNFKTDINTDQAPDVASFSSTGPITNPAAAPRLSFPTNDILKPDIIGPGVSLWAAAPASSLASSSTPTFAMLSGTSMATPHLAGVAALLVERYPSWTPSQVMSAIMTTAYVTNNKRGPIVMGTTGGAATPWDMGAGHVNPKGLMDPGLTFPTNAADYYNFLAGQNLDYAKTVAPIGTKLTPIPAYNLNRPTISVSRLNKTVLLTRWVQNVADTVSNYTAYIVAPPGVITLINPHRFTIPPMGIVSFALRFTVVTASPDFQFGSLTWRDQFGHVVRSVLAVQPLYQ
ncbi:hypothetical protein CLOM_g629 [Closterium sp. NIES-68]|nr:hypothetical protein CLOM_g629 [Closterium sp. NIES-68]GJP60997.1 hypothetical protein CLOP_g18208 [Closterium sp. NIES-67]GJP65623.1 hypothetical protein CLOP_g22494 [Closterium sp. NIES-67]